jgi:hypothetical protein
MTSSAKALRALERAAMRYMESLDHCDEIEMDDSAGPRQWMPAYRSQLLRWKQLKIAYTNHAAALKRKRTGRR